MQLLVFVATVHPPIIVPSSLQATKNLQLDKSNVFFKKETSHPKSFKYSSQSTKEMLIPPKPLSIFFNSNLLV